MFPKQSSHQHLGRSVLFPPPFSLETKKALQMDLESLLTHKARIHIINMLERAARPSGCYQPGTPTRQSPCLAFTFSSGNLPNIAAIIY